MIRPDDPTAGTPGAKDHLDDDIRLDLLHDLLPPPERERALDHLAECPACEELFRAEAAALERLRARPIGAPAGAAAAAGPEAPAAERRLWLFGGWQRPAVRWAAVAMAAAAVLAIVFLPHGGGDAWPALTRLPAGGGEVLLRDATSGRQSAPEMARALDAYERGDWARAARMLARLDPPANLRTLRDIYLGSALAWEGRHRRAAAVLAPVADLDVPDPWGSEARWTLYVSLRRSGQAASADSLLQVLSREPLELGDRARREMERLAGR